MQLPPQKVTFREMADDIMYLILLPQSFCKSKIISKILQKKFEKREKKGSSVPQEKAACCRERWLQSCRNYRQSVVAEE